MIDYLRALTRHTAGISCSPDWRVVKLAWSPFSHGVTSLMMLGTLTTRSFTNFTISIFEYKSIEIIKIEKGFVNNSTAAS